MGGALNLADWPIGGESGKSYRHRLESGFFGRWLSGPVVLDIGWRGSGATILPTAIGVDLDFPGYDRRRLPFEDSSVDAVYSSHVLEHVADAVETLRDWHRVLRPGGYIVCIVPHQWLYERRSGPPSAWNPDHKRFFTPASLLATVESALDTLTYRVRHLADNDLGYNYSISPYQHAVGCYEIELVVERL